jgi:BASS family bile acid:Na+ symporter
VADNTLLVLFLPIALAVVMAGLGLHLTLADFRRVLAAPKAVGVALVVQALLLPPLAVLLCRVFSLNISLTAINSLLALFTLPIWTALALSNFLGAEASVPPPTGKVLEVATLVIVPVALGMALRAWNPVLADAAEKPVRLLSSLLLGVLIALAFISEWDTVRQFAPVVGLACISFNVISLLAGYFVPRALKLAEPQAIAIGFEIGIHNGTLAIFIAIEVLGRTQATIAPAIYSLSMYLTAALFAAWLLHKRPRRA